LYVSEGKVEEIRKLARGKGLIIFIDSNSRSKLWHDTQTNQRDKNLEEFIITSDLLLMNEETSIPTFETIRGRSWIDLTLCNNILAQKLLEDGRADRMKAVPTTI
jgi:tRNA A37 threonylcarbamoyladenosine synthetase subunit TsaC/SUA5/YrdC